MIEKEQLLKIKEEFELGNITEDQMDDETKEAIADVFKAEIQESENNIAEYENINVNNKIFTSEEIEKIKNSRYPKEKKDKKLVSIKGNFIVTQINIKNQYIIVENKNNDDLMRIYYCTDLIGAMQGFKDKFKQAIDDEGKEFYIEASYFLNKKNEITLIKIQEIL